MNKQDSIKPIDLAVALALSTKGQQQSPTYSHLGQVLGVSSSTTFESVQRLQSSGLLNADTREPNRHALLGFLEHGVKHAFPPSLGREVRGIPTAHAGPVLREAFDSEKPIVWPDPHGSARGTSLVPLYPKAVDLPQREPELYSVLTLVDALRVGQARERKLAMSALKSALASEHG